MSEAYSVELEESKLDLKKQDTKPVGSWKTTYTHKQSLKKDSQKPKYMMTLRKLILQSFQESTSSQEDSHAKTSATLEKELALRGVVVHSGNITCKPLGFYDQNTHSLRTFQHSLIEDSMLSLVTLPRSGMMRNGIVYQLPALVRYTRETESSSLPTPQESDYRNKPTSKSWKAKGGINWSLGNPEIRQMWPTPLASETEKNPTGGLTRAVWKAFPTPISGDWKGQKRKDGTSGMLSGVQVTGGGQLNPTWVEWLMGFPLGWTELSDLEMQSFRNVQKSLRKQSKKKT